ncbi:MAG: YitT family protein [Desulfobulbaceae bacterium]|nr:MAG: YitT family protein [Desulfobulbaceae bacterium]
MRNPQRLVLSVKQLLVDIVLLCSGSALCAIAINGILLPNHFVTGGVTGITLIVHKLLPNFPVSWIYLLLNVPLFILAWMAVGRRFFFYSILGTLTLSFAIAFVHIPIELTDPILNALLAGLILGIGAGLCLRSSGSQGGTDILSVMLLKRFSIGLGSTILFVNSLVLLLISIFYSIEAVLYTLIVLFVSAKVVNLVVTGLSQRKAVLIISPQWEKISQEILKDIKRGVTIIRGQGGYNKGDEQIIYSVIPLTEIGQLKRLINNIDPNAFVVISDTLEVINYRIGNQPHW